MSKLETERLQEHSLILEGDWGKKIFDSKTLLVCLDETGHEKLKDPNHPVFGLAGCAVMVEDYVRMIETPWQDICTNYLSDFARPIHAVRLKGLNERQIDILNTFFTRCEFFRVAAICTDKTLNTTPHSLVEVLGITMLKRIEEIAKWTSLTRICILTEKSERLGTTVIRSLSGKHGTKKDGTHVPIEVYGIPKSAKMAAMEVADLIAHTVGVQTRNRINGGKGVRKDFQATFRDVDPRLTSFFEITKIQHKE